MAASIGRDDLLDRVDLGEVLDAFCGPRTTSGRWHCPDVDHTDEHPSVTIRTTDKGRQTWRCWSGGHRGTAIDAVMANQRIGVRDAIVWLAENYAHLPVVERPPGPPRRPVGEPDERVLDYIHSAAKLLWTPAGRPQRNWLHDRGLNDDILHANLVGADPGRRYLGRPRRGFPAGWPAVVYPALDQTGRPSYFQARYLDPPPGRGKYDAPSSTYAANPRLAWTKEIGEPVDRMIVVCEGIPDSLVAAQAGFRAVGVLGTWAVDQETGRFLAASARDADCSLVVCFDGDDAGRASADRLRTQLGDGTTSLLTLIPPRGHDLTTWAASGGDWRAALFEAAAVSMEFDEQFAGLGAPTREMESSLGAALIPARSM
jgi:DNA primase